MLALSIASSQWMAWQCRFTVIAISWHCEVAIILYYPCNTSVISWLYFCSVNGGQTIFLVDTEVWIKKKQKESSRLSIGWDTSSSQYSWHLYLSRCLRRKRRMTSVFGIVLVWKRKSVLTGTQASARNCVLNTDASILTDGNWTSTACIGFIGI